MRYGEFEEEFLVAAYRESAIQGDNRISSGDLLDRYPLRLRDGWVHQLVSDLGSRGLIRGKGVVGDERSQPIMLTAAGMKEAERLIDRGVGIFRLDLGDGIGFPAAEAPADDQVHHTAESDDQAYEGGRAVSVDSASWTGLREFTVNSNNREKVRFGIGEARASLEGESLTNEQKSQAISLLNAAEELLDAPTPPSDIIWELVERAGAIAGIAGLFVTLFLAALG